MPDRERKGEDEWAVMTQSTLRATAGLIPKMDSSHVSKQTSSTCGKDLKNEGRERSMSAAERTLQFMYYCDRQNNKQIYANR